MAEEMVFDDLAPIEVPVSVGGVKYVLREPSEDVARKWRNANIKAAKLADGKVVGLDGLADGQSLLVAWCLYTADEDGKIRLDRDGNPDPRWLVNLNKVRGWRARVVKDLFEKAKEIGQLDEKGAEDAAKNAPAPTPDTSDSPTD